MFRIRRGFLATLSSVCAAGVLGRANAVAQDGPPETTKIRIVKGAPLCWAPEYVADTLLRAEGFVEIERVIVPPADLTPALARGKLEAGAPPFGDAARGLPLLSKIFAWPVTPELEGFVR